MTKDDASPTPVTTRDSFSPLQILDAARSAVPAVDYALGVAGIAAAGAIVAAFLGRGKVSLIIFGGMIVAMVLLFIFARLVKSKSPFITYAGYFLTWAIVLFFVTFLFFTATAMASGWPSIWAGVLGVAVDKVPTIELLVQKIDYGNAGSNQEAIASLVGLASVARNTNEKDEIVEQLTKRLAYPETRDFDTASRVIRKTLFEAILKIRGGNAHVEFSRGELENGDLVGIDARNANLQGIDFKGAFIIGDDFTGSNLKSADFDSTYLRNVQFQNASLDGAIFTKADWFNAEGLTLDQINTVNRSSLERCPKAAGGSYSKRAFIEYANSRYGVEYKGWADEEQRGADRSWSEYMKHGGLCDIVASFQ